MVVRLTSIHEDVGLIPGLPQWVKDLVLLWLWHRPEATALIQSLAWEPPCAEGVALKRLKKKKEGFFVFLCQGNSLDDVSLAKYNHSPRCGHLPCNATY